MSDSDDAPAFRTPTAAIPRLALRADEAAAAFGMSETTFNRLVRAAGVPFVKCGAGHRLFPVAALERWLLARLENPPAATEPENWTLEFADPPKRRRGRAT